MERIGDIFYQISKTIEDKMARKIYFNPEQRNLINELVAILERAFLEMNSNLNKTTYDDVTVNACYDLEEEINVQRNLMRSFNQENIGREGYNTNSAMTFTNLFSNLERIGDHLVNVSESVAGEI